LCPKTRGLSYYQAELCFDRERENRVLSVSSSQFLNRLGRMLVVNELGGELWEVAWDGARYTQSMAGRVPGRWSSQGFMVQGTELEAGCFAVRPLFCPPGLTGQRFRGVELPITHLPRRWMPLATCIYSLKGSMTAAFT
jgi:hypothetical protein